MLTDDSQMIGTAEAAELLGINRATVTRWAKAGKLTPRAKLPGRNAPYVFTRISVAHLAAQRRRERV